MGGFFQPPTYGDETKARVAGWEGYGKNESEKVARRDGMGGTVDM